LLALVTATGCAAAPQRIVGVDQVPEGSKCVQSAALDSFKGQAASTDLAAQMMSAARARTLRWVPFGAMITMEYRDNRLTVRLDQQNRVMSATCG
jgi:hypothetical protein